MKRWAMAAVCCMAMMLGAGASAQTQTFTDVLADALENSPDVIAQRFALRQLDEAVAAARAGMRPNLSGSGSAGVNFRDPVQGDTSYGRTGSVGVAASQSLFDGWQTENAVAAAEANVAAGRLTLMATEQSVVLSAIEAYIGVIQAQQNVSLARNNVQVIARQLEATRARLEVGEVTRTDVAQAEARLAESRANLRSFEGALRSAAEEFERIVGYPPADLEPLPALPGSLPTSVEEAEEIALRSNPTYLAAFASEEAARFGIDQARGALLPQVSLNGDVSASTTQFLDADGVAIDGNASVSVTIPFYSGGALRSAVRSNVFLADQRAQERERTRRQLLRDVGVNWEDLLTARATIVANAEQVEAQRIAFEGVSEEARVGSRTTLDVLDAEQDLLDARVALVNSRSDEQVAAYRLLASMGVLTSDVLGLEVARYDPIGPYEESQRFTLGYPEVEDDDDWMENY